MDSKKSRHLCSVCSYVSIDYGIAHCNNPSCSENPMNYTQIMSCVCGLPECIVCRDQIMEQLEQEKQREVSVQKIKCECGSEKVSGKDCRHSSWCPKFRELE
jgi:hypothetical protein